MLWRTTISSNCWTFSTAWSRRPGAYRSEMTSASSSARRRSRSSTRSRPICPAPSPKRSALSRDEFIGNAKREAEALRKTAEEQAHTMIEEQEVVRVARARSSEMIASAEAKSKELRRVASEYVDELMRQTEQSMSEALATIRNAHNSFQALGGGIAGQTPVTAARPKQGQNAAKPAQNAAKQQAQSAVKEQAQKRSDRLPQGKPDPISSKVQRISRTEEEDA